MKIIFCFALSSLLFGGTINGKITLPSGEPFRDADVRLTLENSTKTFYGRMDSTGNFSITGIDVGRYSLSISSEMYSTKFYPDSINVSADTVIKNVNLQVDKGNHISGRISSYKEEYLPKALKIDVYKRFPGDFWVICAGTYITTNQRTYDTIYSINKMTEGEYKVAINPPPYFNQFYPGKLSLQEAEIITLTKDESRDSVNFTMRKGASISGKITVPASTGLPDQAVIEVIKKNNKPFLFHENGRSVTIADDSFSIGGLDSGEYSISIRPQSSEARPSKLAPQYFGDKYHSNDLTFFKVKEEETVNNINTSLKLGGTISGTIKSEDGSILPLNMFLTIKPLDTNLICYPNSYKIQPRGTSFLYTISGLPTGRWILSANMYNVSTLQPKSYYPNSYSSDSATVIDVSLGETKSLNDFVIPVGGKISGKIVTPDNKPLPREIKLILFHEKERIEKTIISNGIDPVTEYSFSGLPHGTYNLYAIPDDNRYPNEYYTEPVSISTRSDLRNINIRLKAAASIMGTITDLESGKPLVGVTVRAVLDSQYIPFGNVFSNFSYFFAKTDSSGKYTFTGLPAGEYRVFFRNNTYTEGIPYDHKSLNKEFYKNEFYKNALHYSQSEKIVISTGTTVSNIDMSLSKNSFGSIAGYIIFGNGDTCKSFNPRLVECLFDNFIEGYAENYDITYQTGRYIIKGLTPGKYKVRVRYNGHDILNHPTEVTVVADDTTENINLFYPTPVHLEQLNQEKEICTGLGGNFPNPFNPTTTIRYSLSAKDLIVSKTNILTIYDIRGKTIRSFPLTATKPGRYSVMWDGKNSQNRLCGTGVYIYKLVLNTKSFSRKMFMVR